MRTTGWVNVVPAVSRALLQRRGGGRDVPRIESGEPPREVQRRAVAEDRERAGELGRAGAERLEPAQEPGREALGAEVAHAFLARLGRRDALAAASASSARR